MKRYSCMSSLHRIGNNAYNNSFQGDPEVFEEGVEEAENVEFQECVDADQNAPNNNPFIDEQIWTLISALKDQACRNIPLVAEEPGAPEPNLCDACYSYLSENQDENPMVTLPDYIDYEPNSDFLTHTKNEILNQLQPLKTFTDNSHICESCLGTPNFASTFYGNETLKKLKPRSAENRRHRRSSSNKPQQMRSSKKSPNRRAESVCYTLEDLKVLGDAIERNRNQTTDSKVEQPCTNLRRSEKPKEKSQHVSRSKKPSRYRSRKARQSIEQTRSQENFEPSLKRPHENSCERCWRFASPSRSPVNKPDQRFDPNFRKGHSSTDVVAYDSDTEAVEMIDQNLRSNETTTESKHCTCSKQLLQSSRQKEQSEPHFNTPITQRSGQLMGSSKSGSSDIKYGPPKCRFVDQGTPRSQLLDNTNNKSGMVRCPGIINSGSNRRPRPKSCTPGATPRDRTYFENILRGLNTTEFFANGSGSERRHGETNVSTGSPRNDNQLPAFCRKLQLSKMSDQNSRANYNSMQTLQRANGNSFVKSPNNKVPSNQGTLSTSRTNPDMQTNRSRTSPQRTLSPPSRNNGAQNNIPCSGAPPSNASPQDCVYFENILRGLNTTEFFASDTGSERPHGETNLSMGSPRNENQLPAFCRKLQLSKMSDQNSRANYSSMQTLQRANGNSFVKSPNKQVPSNQGTLSTSRTNPDMQTNRSRTSPQRTLSPPSRNNGAQNNIPCRQAPTNSGSPRIMRSMSPNRTQSSNVIQENFPQEQLNQTFRISPSQQYARPNTADVSQSQQLKECPCFTKKFTARNNQNGERVPTVCCPCPRKLKSKSPNKVNQNLPLNRSENVPINEATFTKPSFEYYEGTFPPGSYEVTEDYFPTLSSIENVNTTYNNNENCLRPQSLPYPIPGNEMNGNPVGNDFDFNPPPSRQTVQMGALQSPQGKKGPCPHQIPANDRTYAMNQPQNRSNEKSAHRKKEKRQSPPNYSFNVPPCSFPPVKYSVFYMTKSKEDKDNKVEVLVEELTRRSSDATDTRTQDLTNKMKKVLECHSDSMALRFQKGVLESCQSPKSSRVLYF